MRFFVVLLLALLCAFGGARKAAVTAKKTQDSQVTLPPPHRQQHDSSTELFALNSHITTLEDEPSAEPTDAPTDVPSETPTLAPTTPTANPTAMPTGPSSPPTPTPTETPTLDPTPRPSRRPSIKPTKQPSFPPTRAPRANPTMRPTRPTMMPTTTDKPSTIPTAIPTLPARGLQFDSTFTFRNLSTNILNGDDQQAVIDAAASVMSLDSMYVTFVYQSAEAAGDAVVSDGLSVRKEVEAIALFDILATILTEPPLEDGQSPIALYDTLSSALATAVEGQEYILALKLAQVRINEMTTFDEIRADQCAVEIAQVVVLGQPTAVPTPGPTGHRAHRLANAPLAGTVVSVVVGCALIAVGIYFAIIYMRKYRVMEFANQSVRAAEEEKKKVPEVELPWQLDYGQPEHLRSVHRRELRGEVSASASRPMKQGVVQIVFETDQI